MPGTGNHIGTSPTSARTTLAGSRSSDWIYGRIRRSTSAASSASRRGEGPGVDRQGQPPGGPPSRDRLAQVRLAATTVRWRSASCATHRRAIRRRGHPASRQSRASVRRDPSCRARPLGRRSPGVAELSDHAGCRSDRRPLLSYRCCARPALGTADPSRRLDLRSRHPQRSVSPRRSKREPPSPARRPRRW